MTEDFLQKIKVAISERHKGDTSQLDVIFSPHRRLLVEAPAGYGKTNTMISKIAYMFATGQVPYPKRMLALTFSVNAAYKIKKDVNKQIPDLLQGWSPNFILGDKLFVSNYHGFCRNVLKKYGYVLSPALRGIESLQSIDDSDANSLMELLKNLSYEDALLLSNFNVAIKKHDSKFLNDNFTTYNNVVIKEILSLGLIPYNAILTLTIILLTRYPNVLSYYRKYFNSILVDEYQDTNILAYKLITLLITDESQVILLGDPLQRIYGFIGAIPDLLPTSQKKFGLFKYSLKQNHRFASNVEMLQLDLNLRRNAENPVKPLIRKDALIDLNIYNNQHTEALKIVEKASLIVSSNPGSKVAILIRQRGPNVNQIIDAFDKAKVPYFYGLFTDEDPAYIKFHKSCLLEFLHLMKGKEKVVGGIATTHVERIGKAFNSTPLNTSLLSLLKIFWGKVFTDFAFLSNEDKISLIRDTFEYNSLKQYIEFSNAKIIISTVHAAKGLEWDFVLLPDMEQNRFPSWYGLCEKCTNRTDCNLIINNQIQKDFLEELSVFYVAVTRAKAKVIFSASQSQISSNNIEKECNISCFLKLPGIRFSTWSFK
jgi:DNA helicase-2/ATP-dependent DNA helicase PcrA